MNDRYNMSRYYHCFLGSHSYRQNPGRDLKGHANSNIHGLQRLRGTCESSFVNILFAVLFASANREPASILQHKIIGSAFDEASLGRLLPSGAMPASSGNSMYLTNTAPIYNPKASGASHPIPSMSNGSDYSIGNLPSGTAFSQKKKFIQFLGLGRACQAHYCLQGTLQAPHIHMIPVP